MNKRSKYLKTIGLSVLTGILFLSCSGNEPSETAAESPARVKLAGAGSGPGERVLASGQIAARETAVISTRVMGFIATVNVRPGDAVHKGQLLATISNDDILAKKAQASALVTEAEAALADAKKDYERFGELYKQQSASVKEFENATLHYNSVKARTEAARQMRNEADAMLSYTRLTAPFAGVVVQQNADAGSMASPGMPILMLERAGGYQVNATVAETDIIKIKEGTAAEVVVKSTGKVLEGTVFEVSPSSQFSGGQYAIKVRIPSEAGPDVYSGMYVSVTMTATGPLPGGEGTILVPVSAIVHRDQLTGLYTVSQHHTALLRWVRLGKTYGDHVEVLSGLGRDEKFIVESERKLYNGAPVTVQ